MPKEKIDKIHKYEDKFKDFDTIGGSGAKNEQKWGSQPVILVSNGFYDKN